MADANAFVVFRRWAVTNAEWMPICAPCLCNTFVLSEANGKAFKISSDPANPDAWQQIEAGNGYEFAWAPRALPQNLSSSGIRFNPGDTICYAQAIDGTGAVVICNCGL